MLIGTGNLSGTGTVESAPFPHRGGDVEINLNGSAFGGATVRLFVSKNQGKTYSPVKDSDKTDFDSYIATVTNESLLKLVATGGTNININWDASVSSVN